MRLALCASRDFETAAQQSGGTATHNYLNVPPNTLRLALYGGYLC